MHPAGIKYGLANNLLQMRGSSILLSDRLLENISAAARHQLHGKRIDGGGLLDNVIDRALTRSEIVYEGARGEANAFYAQLDIVLFYSIYPYAERAGIGYRTGRAFYFTRAFASELVERKKILQPAGDVYGYEKMLFLACYDAVVARCRRETLEESRHADLLALCMFEAYDTIVMNNFMERFGRS